MLWFSQLLALGEIKVCYWLAFSSSLLPCRRTDLGCLLAKALLWLCLNIVAVMHEGEARSLNSTELKAGYFTSPGCLLLEGSLRDPD